METESAVKTRSSDRILAILAFHKIGDGRVNPQTASQMLKRVGYSAACLSGDGQNFFPLAIRIAYSR